MQKNSLKILVLMLLMLCMSVAGVAISSTAAVAASTDIDAAFGTNNSTAYWPANGSGGTVEFYSRTCTPGWWWWGSCHKWTYSWTSMSSGDSSTVAPYSTSPSFRVTPAAGYRIKFIKYAKRTVSFGNDMSSATWTSVTDFEPASANVISLSDIAISNSAYVLWVAFEPASSTYDVTANVYQDSVPTSCQQSSHVTQIGSVTGNNVYTLTTQVSANQTTAVKFVAGSGCEVEDVLFNGNSVGVQTSPYTTPAITSTSTVVVKFRPVSYTITASIDPASPGYVAASGLATSGAISPAGATQVPGNSSQTFSITPASGYRILNVRVTDTNAGYTNMDLGAITNQYGTSYTFKNVTANGSIIVTFAVDSTTASNYCQTPPFLSGQTKLQPNLLIIFDTSGSMGDYAYSANQATYSPSKTYYGYYDTSKMYTITTSTVHSISSAGLDLSANCATQKTGNICSGNELNFRNMKKVDVIRKILMGGKISNRTAATKYLVTHNSKTIEYGASLPTGVVQALDGKVRFGLMVFNQNLSNIGDGDGGRIVANIGETTSNLVSYMESSSTDPSGNTPLAESLYEAVRYFQAMPSAYNSGVDYSSVDPIQYPCQKNFVMLITDGQPTSDANIPGQSNATVSDSNYTAWKTLAAAKTVKPKEGLLPWVAYYAHVNDLRSATVGKTDILGKQVLTLYTIYTFGDGTGTSILQEASKFGAFNDSDNSGTSGYLVPDKTKEYHAADDGSTVPDTYYEANEGEVLEANITAAMTDILARVASGTAASILSNSEGSGANLLQAVFYPDKIFKQSTEVNWIGEMQNLWYYVDPFMSNSTVREDTDFSASTSPTPDYHLLSLKNDYVTQFYFNGTETLAQTSQDTDGDGLGDTIINPTANPDSVLSIWRAGKLLRSRSADSRTIHTSIDGLSLYSPTTDAKGGFYSDTTRATALMPYLQAANITESQKLIDYIRGTDQSGYRTRKVALLDADTPTEWKLGDIISSTPRIQSSIKLNFYNIDSPTGYGDKSYGAFIKTSAYQNRGMVYVGANDGMLHAFKLGKLTVSGTTDVPKASSNNCAGGRYTSTGYCIIADDLKATLTGTNLGQEQWSYIPRNALPYLKYFSDPVSYKHLYYVDGPTVLVDAAVAGCLDKSDYSMCARDNSGGTNWKTILIGSMGLGGASRIKGDGCTNGSSGTCVKTPIFDPAAGANTTGLGYSSYFALDISNQYFDSSGNLVGQPTLKWEFSHPELGFATSGAAIVRIATKKTDPLTSKIIADTTTNGKWFAVFASGPTGPIDEVAHQFLGRSDQELKLFVVDLGATGKLTKDTNFWIIPTGIKRAFGGNILNGSIDTDRWKKAANGNYQDNAVYVGYTKANINDAADITATTEWTNGGVIRLITNEDLNPANWKTSTVISGIGPVTSAIARLQDRKYHKLWLYFGTGRFYYGGDDSSNPRHIVGVQDPCYHRDSLNRDTLDGSCADSPPAPLTKDDLQLADTPPADIGTKQGWYISLDPESASTSMGAERCITDPVALTNGLVVFTTFKPTSDVCKFGGESYLWGVKYNNGGTPLNASLGAKVLVQESTGAFEEKTLKTTLTYNYNRKQATAMSGKPPADQPPIITNAGNKPPKRILHIQEK